MALDIQSVRAQYPALQRKAIFFDNPAGTQVAQHVLDKVSHYLIETNANHAGQFETSRKSDEMMQETRSACADLYKASRPEEIVFGPNMTSLTLNISRSLARTLSPGDKIVVTRMDHDANITPWKLIAEDRGAELVWVDMDVEDGTLKLETLDQALETKPKIVAVGYASNALGTINPVKEIIDKAKAVGALTFIDAVQYAPHGIIDVQDLGCDFLVSSAYKFFATHVGVLYGRYDLLEGLTAYKVRAAPNSSPNKWETGTPNFEGIAGVLGAVELFEWLATEFGSGGATRRARIEEGMRHLRAYEEQLSGHLIRTLSDIPGVRIYGLTDLNRLNERVPTVSFTLEGKSPAEIARYLGDRDIYVWNGHYYAISAIERLGLGETGGMVRVGPVHYNTFDEIDHFGEILRQI